MHKTTCVVVTGLNRHDGPVWCVSWAHPKFGNILASSSYDAKVIIWRETNAQWTKLTEHTNHHASGMFLFFHCNYKFRIFVSKAKKGGGWKSKEYFDKGIIFDN